jgi:hypothetical protein
MESWRPAEADITVKRSACLGIDLPLGGHLAIEFHQRAHGSLVQPIASIVLVRREEGPL